MRSKIETNRPHWHLNLHSKWFDMIASGVKKQEYRSISKYWKTRFCKQFPEDPNNGSYPEIPQTIIFSNGYRKDRRQFEIEWISTRISEGREDWGAKEGEKYYVICLGRVLQRNF